MYAKLIDGRIILNVKAVEFYIDEGTAYAHFNYNDVKDDGDTKSFTIEVFNIKYIAK